MCGCGVCVNVVVLGLVVIELFLQGKSLEFVDWFVKLNLFEWFGQFDDVVCVVVFFVGLDGVWINGQILCVNGGMC